MAVLFVSHASKDDAYADVVEAWLKANGFTDIFVDHHSVGGGDKWREALKASANSCRVIICLVTENWLGSHQCFGEFNAASYMGKRIVPLFLVPDAPHLDAEGKSRLAMVLGEDQGIKVAHCIASDGVLDLEQDQDVASRLRLGLRAAGANTHVGLDPEAFAIDTKLRTAPFPGLASFGDDDGDAALFYGRSREIAHVLEDLRSMRALNDQRPLVIQGASGAGKSSLLKAGVIPRLRRQMPAWLPLRAFRPGANPLLNFADALSITLADFGQREAQGNIRDRLFGEWEQAERDDEAKLTPSGLAKLETAIEAEGARLRTAAGRPGASILISVDQAEEITRAEDKSGEALADYLRAALGCQGSPWQLIFTIRSDSFPELQRHPRFQDLDARGYDLRSIPVFRFDTVVEQPAMRYGVEVDPALVDALMEDAPKEDALPLLAFALQRLWRQYAASGSLTKGNYDKVGGLKGLIEDAAERAICGFEPEQDVPLPPGPLPKWQAELAAATFVPALAEIDDKGATIRHIADWSSFSEEQQDLLKRLDRWRLVVRKGKADGGTVEVAHDALFRTWKRLESWLEPERARLEALRTLQVDAAAWERNGRDVGFLNHRGKRLDEVAALSRNAGYGRRLVDRDFDYIAASQVAERVVKARARRGLALVSALALLLIAAGAGWWQQVWLQERYFRLTSMGLSVLTAERERALEPKQDFVECAKGCPTMVVVPAGKFMMGSAKTEEGRRDNEGPRHEVTLADPFAVSKFAVTFAEWDACVAAGACPRAPDTPSGREDRPAINIGWEEAKKYVAWLSRSTGKTYRLLSEAEWEYAARAGSMTAYSWGDGIGKGNANCIGCGSQWDGKQTAPVGSFKPDAFGLYDMLGNVWQWVEDCYHEGYEGAPTDGSAWTTGECDAHVVRGGSWYDGPVYLRSASRGRAPYGRRGSLLGFRVARTLT